MDEIGCLSEDHVRSILTALCNDERIRGKVLNLSRKLHNSEYARHEHTTEYTSSFKELAICVQCNKTFEPVKGNGQRDCRYPPGKLNASKRVSDKVLLYAEALIHFFLPG